MYNYHIILNVFYCQIFIWKSDMKCVAIGCVSKWTKFLFLLLKIMRNGDHESSYHPKVVYPNFPQALKQLNVHNAYRFGRHVLKLWIEYNSSLSKFAYAIFQKKMRKKCEHVPRLAAYKWDRFSDFFQKFWLLFHL